MGKWDKVNGNGAVAGMRPAVSGAGSGPRACDAAVEAQTRVEQPPLRGVVLG
jgi:hypothetical protein